MPKYVFVYHGGKKPETPEAGEKVMAAWNAWMEGMGESLTEPGHPVGLSTTVSGAGVADNGGSNPVSGISYVEAADMAGAVEMAKGCPILAEDGSVEIAEVLSM